MRFGTIPPNIEGEHPGVVRDLPPLFPVHQPHERLATRRLFRVPPTEKAKMPEFLSELPSHANGRTSNLDIFNVHHLLGTAGLQGHYGLNPRLCNSVHEFVTRLKDGRVVKVSDPGWPCHEFELSIIKDPSCRGAMHANPLSNAL
ncbi:hypothetical protein TNCV_1778031 [Trichonephila clavipes]|nr:hypothetical protein TNCV_1778031 [Trichonephila clavipes]